MGTHVSKVKSVTLDRWEEEMVAFMQGKKEAIGLKKQDKRKRTDEREERKSIKDIRKV